MIRRTLIVAGGTAAAAGLWLAAAMVFPWLLLFPHHRMVGQTPVWSEAPLTDGIEAVIRRSDARLRASPLYRPEASRRPVYLTDGGLRWRILSFDAAGAFAQTRAIRETVVVNRSSIERDRVWNRAPVAGERRLSDVIAHERTHGLIRMRFGVTADAIYPLWVREGYCDHVAGSSSLSDAEAARLTAERRNPPALAYYQARKRVEAALRANGGSVDRLFASARPR